MSTEPVGNNGYMNWKQIKEIEKENFVTIGHHSHSHEYLIEKTNQEFVDDIEKASSIFRKELDMFQNYFPTLLESIQNI